jgi:hypothetical protein
VTAPRVEIYGEPPDQIAEVDGVRYRLVDVTALDGGGSRWILGERIEPDEAVA